MAMYENSEMMDKEIERLVKTLQTLDPTSEDYKTVRINLNTLYELRNAQYKVDTEDLEKRDKSEAELKQKANELEVRKSELESVKQKNESDAKQKANELDVRKKELESIDQKNESDAQQKRDELEFKRQELAVREREIALAEKRLGFEERQKNEENSLRKEEQQLNAKRLEFEERQKNEENDLRTYELELSEKQHNDTIKSQKKDRITNCAITAVNVVKDVLKIGFLVGTTIYVAREGYKFEETGTPTSKTFREELKGILDIFKKS